MAARPEDGRNYYAELDIPFGADEAEVRKAHRKLALKYHPDRNPGTEEEAKRQFQVIQSAFDFLSDPVAKVKYDDKYFSKFGPKRPPKWQQDFDRANEKFGPPPSRTSARTRPPPPPTQPKGGSRWRDFKQVPPTAKEKAKDGDSFRNYEAFYHMRPKSQTNVRAEKKEAAAPPPVPPRNQEPQRPSRGDPSRERSEAAFGKRRSGYYPHSPVRGDEPPVASTKNYETSRHTTKLFGETSSRDGAAAAAAAMAGAAAHAAASEGPAAGKSEGMDRRDSYFRTRQPHDEYHSNPGYKYDPFEGTDRRESLSGRSRGERSGSDGVSAPRRDRRSSSVPKAKGGPDADAFSRLGVDDDGGRPRTAGQNATASAFSQDSFASRTSRGRPDQSDGVSPTTAHPAADGGASSPKKGRPMYEKPHPPKPSQCAGKHEASTNGTRQSCNVHKGELASSPSGDSSSSASSDQNSLYAFEAKQSKLLRGLIDSASSCGSDRRGSLDALRETCADMRNCHSFQFDDTPSKPQAFNSRASAGDIRFAPEQDPGAYQFSAGGATKSADDLRSRGRDGQSSPTRPTVRVDDDAAPPQGGAEGAGPGTGTGTGTGPAFDPREWAPKFNEQTFAPQPSNGASPSRHAGSMKRAKHIRPTMGNAGLVSEGATSTSEGEDPKRGRPVETVHVGADSPNAMDIDPPPHESPAPPANGARNIPVEPSRPDWRAGDASGGHFRFDPNSVGSEDAEALRATMADLGKVAPLAPEGGGLGSLGDLKHNLPFESKPAARAPIPRKPVSDVAMPPAPRAPGNQASPSYLAEFQDYMCKWDEYNAKVVGHFQARVAERNREGYAFLIAQGDEKLVEYAQSVRVDGNVRHKWLDACDEHEKRIREFAEFRKRMR